MDAVNTIVSIIQSAEDATSAVTIISGMDHVLTSKKESSQLLNNRAKELGFRWDKGTGTYEVA